MRHKAILLKCIEFSGVRKQETIVIEEMAELTKAIVKYWRTDEGRASIVEEIADVEIMLDQLKLIHDIQEWELNAVRDQKINRLKAGFYKSI